VLRSASVRLLSPIVTPFSEILNGLDRCLSRSPKGGLRSLAVIFLGLLVGWWIYVPVHELLHAAACAVAGGGVSRLEIDSMYGGALLARVFPFVVSGSEYAGRLSGFDTRGSDHQALALPLHVASAYRSTAVNRIVGGASTSQHLLGQAADFHLTITQARPVHSCGILPPAWSLSGLSPLRLDRSPLGCAAHPPRVQQRRPECITVATAAHCGQPHIDEQVKSS
jgi:hypothetical protein